MKLPLSWLSEFVAFDAALEELCRRLTLAGLEVEDIAHKHRSFSGVSIARVTHVERHPNADRLNLCQVDGGAIGRFSVVCGAPNVTAGMTAAFARVGARLAASGHGGRAAAGLDDAQPLEAAIIRGVRSEGMLCSERELGISDDHAGILALPADAPLGADFAEYIGAEDTVLDIAITPNRGDCLSILGLAREVAALFGAPLTMPAIDRSILKSTPGIAARESELRVEILAPELCPHYAGLPMSDVRIGPSPIRIRRRLELCGMRALNNVVDATNYVMIELGQPLHAFDRARIARGTIIVRRAEQGPHGADREFVTLDNQRREMAAADLLIADPEKPLAIAGVMGGLNSEVAAATTDIVLESAYFEPMAIARTARRLGLRSEASYRFERAIDRGGQLRALARVANLIAERGGARASGPAIDVEPRPAPERKVVIDLGRVASLLGVEILAAEAARRLESIGATVAESSDGKLTVIAPSFRPDLNEVADFAEELARVKGLSEIPAVLPTRTSGVPIPDARRIFMGAAREVMLGGGLTEVRTLAFVAPADNQRYGGLGGEPVRVTNPLSAELGEMRLSLLPGVLTALRFNLNREATAFHAFEIGKVFASANGQVTEHERLAAASYGDYAMGTVGQAAIRAGFYTLKGLLEAWFESLGAGRLVEFTEPAENLKRFLHPGRSATVMLSGQTIGYLGELHPAESLRMDLGSTCVLCEVDLALLLELRSSTRLRVEAPPRFPAIRRDLALVLEGDFPAMEAVRSVIETKTPYLESVEIFDVYSGESIAPGKKSVALACRYRDRDRTLTDEEVNRIHAGLVERVRQKLGAELRQ